MKKPTHSDFKKLLERDMKKWGIFAVGQRYNWVDGKGFVAIRKDSKEWMNAHYEIGLIHNHE